MKTNTLNPDQNHKQALANLLKATYQNLTDETQQALHDVAHIGYTATEHGGYQQEHCHTIYQQLMNWECKMTDSNLNQLTDLLADLIDIAIENLRSINYGTLDSPYYRTPFFNAIKQALPKKSQEANRCVDNLLYQFGRGWKTLPQKKHPLAAQWAQPIANLPAY
jgi:hypothetical protein